jgi:hypothetical protein
MVPLPVVVRHELVEGAEQPTLPEQDEAVTMSDGLRPPRSERDRFRAVS